MWQVSLWTQQDSLKRTWRWLLLFLTLFLGYPLETAVQAKESNTTPVAEKIEFRDGKLTVRLVNASVPRILSEIGRRSGVEIVWLNHAMADTVSVEFTALPVAEALERILRGKNFLLFYTIQGKKEKLARVWISSPPGGKRPLSVRTVATTPTQSAAALSPSTQPLQGGEEEIEGQPSPFSMPLDEVIQIALGEKNPEIRLDAIARLGQEIPENPQIRELLSRIAREDSDPDARQGAALTLGEGKE